jgi:molybdopterin-guanine dinucleotide biosynthesis protein A
MGRDKAAIPFPGPQDPPIIHQIHRWLSGAARECLVAAPETYGLPARRLALVVAADLPCPEPQLAAHLLELAAADPEADVVVPVTSRGPEPMFAVYRTQALAQLAGAGRRGSARGPSLREALALVRVHEVLEPEWRRLDPVGASFTDCDTPRELAVAVGLAAGRREE